MQASSKQALIEHLRARTFRSALDAPSGNGWLRAGLGPDCALDGIDLYAGTPKGYRRFWGWDLDRGLPPESGGYDLVCCCEGLEHVGNPLLLLRECHRALLDDGLLVITTPNVWYPQARLQYLLRGFFPSFPALGGKVAPGTHMHITPWSFPQLYTYLTLAGFDRLEIVREALSEPKHFHERLLGIPARLYCRGRLKKAASDEERRFWEMAGSDASILGRHLIVTARKKPGVGS